MKMDYNDTIGIGCDGAESLGEVFAVTVRHLLTLCVK